MKYFWNQDLIATPVSTKISRSIMLFHLPFSENCLPKISARFHKLIASPDKRK
jgi:hypothetical protein